MAASVYSSVRVFSGSGVTSLTSASFGVGGSNRAMVAFAGSGAGSPATPTSVKWQGSGGTDFTQIGSTQNADSFRRMCSYRLTAPAAATDTLYCLWPSAQDETALIGAALQDVDQTTPNGTVAQATGTGTTPTVNATTTVGQLVIDGVWHGDVGNDRTLTAGANQTAIQEIEGADLSYEAMGVSQETASSTTTTMSWSVSGSPSAWAITAIPINGDGGGGGGGLPFFLQQDVLSGGLQQLAGGFQ